MSQIPFHYQIADLVMDLMKQGTHRSAVQEKIERGHIVLLENEVKTFQLQGEIFISSADIYTDLNLSAIKLVIQIQQELKMNNPLWECKEKDKRNVRLALAQLKKKGILFPVEHTAMYIVNPAMIRKGRPLSVYGALYEYSRKMYQKDKKWKPTTEDIRRLLAPRSLEMSVTEGFVDLS